MRRARRLHVEDDGGWPDRVSKPLHIALPPGCARHRGRHCRLPSHLQLKVRDDISAVSDMTNQLEWMRKQIEDE